MYLKYLVFYCIMQILFFSGTFQPLMAQQAISPTDCWEQGLQAYNNQDYNGALKTWLKGLETGEASGWFQGQGVLYKIKLLKGVGGVYFHLGNHVQRLPIYLEALNLAKELENPAMMVDLYIDLGFAYQYLGRYEEALAKYSTAQIIIKKLDGHHSEGRLLNGLGQVHSLLAQYDQALSAYQQTLQFARDQNIRWLEGSAQLHIGMLHLDRGILDEALVHLDKAHSIAQALEVEDPRGQSATVNSLGNFYNSLRQHDEALKYHQQSLAIKQRINDKYGQGIAYLNIGNTHKFMGHLDQAIQAYEASLKICREIQDKSGEAHALNNLGVILLAKKEYDASLARFRQGFAIADQIKSPELRCLAKMNIGVSLDGMGKTTEGYQAIEQSLEICSQADSPDALWRVHENLGRIEADMRQYGKAIANYEKAIGYIETMREGVPDSQGKMSFIQDKLSVYDQLIGLYQKRHIQNPNKGYDRKALEIFERKQGRAFLAAMGRSGARRFAGLPDDVLRSEISLPERLANTKNRIKDELNKPLKTRDVKLVQSLTAKLSLLEAEQKELEKTIRKKFPTYYALKYPLPTGVQELQNTVLKPDEIMLIYGVMDHTTCLWIVGKNHFSMYTIERGEAALQSEIEALLDQSKRVGNAISNSNRSSRLIRREVTDSLEEIIPASRNLFGLLIPLEARKALTGAKTLYVIPTGSLYQLPFETLVLPKTDPGQTSQYLLEKYAIAYLSSASLLKTLRASEYVQREQAKYPLLAIANPIYQREPSIKKNKSNASVSELRSSSYFELMGGDFAPLPETEKEVKLIKKILSAPEESNPLQLRQNAARSNVFRLHDNGYLDDYRYIVFSCHGILPGEIDNVSQPALVLSLPDPETGPNGYLTMKDVFQLQLNAQFVTLSACNTGQGQSVKGEGVMGLTRAFMYAGTPSISVTLWSIETSSAAMLTTGFYANLKAGLRKAEALRKIKLRMIRGEESRLYRHPFFWAPMVIFGDGR